MEDTIAAIATPIGSAGIGIVRISGPAAIDVACKIFMAKNKKRIDILQSHSVTYGHIYELESKQLIDEVLVTVMRAPRSFTTEDVVEINCHGGTVAVRKTLETVISAGARLAEPGEFTKRAFLNGRIDLAQAESIMDLINAKTESSLRVALGQLEGDLSKRVKEIRNRLLEIIAHIEAAIDFPEHDIEELTRENVKNNASEIKDMLDKIIKSAESGKVFREGLKTVIVGKPNVGKSSLLNALLREKRAIVTDIPGTTRDVIEEVVNIRGIPLKILDTAGIRETDDVVEKIGVERSREAIELADLFLFVVDAVTGLNSEDQKIADLISAKKGILIINKVDLKNVVEEEFLKPLHLSVKSVQTSLSTGYGLDRLEDEIADFVYKHEFHSPDDLLVSNIRHKEALMQASENLKDVLIAVDSDMPIDCFSIDLRSAWENMGKITGDTVGEDLIDQIFSQFCIGK